jgi:hypothetical protein
VTAINSVATNLVAEAQEQKKELMGLYGRMRETNQGLRELAMITGEFGETLLDVEELCDNHIYDCDSCEVCIECFEGETLSLSEDAIPDETITTDNLG